MKRRLKAHFSRSVLLMTVMFCLIPTSVLVAAPQPTIPLAREQASSHLDLMAFRIKMLHRQAKNSLISTLELPYFTEYFTLPESARNNHDNLGQLQLTDNQHKLRKKLEEWVLVLHNRFPIGETCLIDRSGQEHMRVVGGRLESPHHFSDEEAGSPFFTPTFALNSGEVHISEPYMSPDSLKWVSSFTSPVVLEDGSKPAFYHLEIPLTIYHKIVSSRDFDFYTNQGSGVADVDEEGRFFILNNNGLLIADSKNPFDLDLKDERNPELNPNLPDYLPPERLEDYLPGIDQISNSEAFAEAIAEMKKSKNGILELNIDGQDYVMAFDLVVDRDWYLVHLDPVGNQAFWDEKKM